jgi:hypothetical protein
MCSRFFCFHWNLIIFVERNFMTSAQSIRLFELTLEFVKDKDKAREYVQKIEATIDDKLVEKEKILATKEDIYQTKKEINDAKVDIIKWMVGTGIAVVGLIVAFLKLTH